MVIIQNIHSRLAFQDLIIIFSLLFDIELLLGCGCYQRVFLSVIDKIFNCVFCGKCSNLAKTVNTEIKRNF